MEQILTRSKGWRPQSEKKYVGDLFHSSLASAKSKLLITADRLAVCHADLILHYYSPHLTARYKMVCPTQEEGTMVCKKAGILSPPLRSHYSE